MPALLKPKDRKRAEKAVTTYRGGREVCNTKTKRGRDEYHRRVVEMCRRQGWLCSICEKPMHIGNPPTFEHANGRGGGKRDDRVEINGKPANSAAHGWCNAMAGSPKRSGRTSPDESTMSGSRRGGKR